MADHAIDLTPLRRALAMLNEALGFWRAQPDGTTLQAHQVQAQAVAEGAAAFAGEAVQLLAALEASLAR